MPDKKLLLATGERVTDVALKKYEPTFAELIAKLSNPQMGIKDGSYFIRCAGIARNNQDTADTASILILDGDSQINTATGDIVSGAVDPVLVHGVLAKLRFNHCIYSSFSNDVDYHKHRVIIPCEYSREQLPILLDYLFAELHNHKVMLAPVNENKTWAQAWYFPRCNRDNVDSFQFYKYTEGNNLDADATQQGWLTKYPAPDPIEPPPIIRKSTIDYDDNGKRNPIREFNQANVLHDILIRNGYTLKNNAYIRPDSASGIPGVKLCLDCKDGVGRAYSHGNDALNNGFAHDSFDCYRLLECGGDINKALAWNDEINRHNQAIHRNEQGAKPKENTGKNSNVFDLSKFSLSGKSKELEQKMLDDRFVMKDLAILGQATVIYAKPNAGKTLITLRLIVDAVKNGDIVGKNVFYINADDTYKGMVQKLKIAEKTGFHMLSPGQNGFEAKAFLGYLQQMVIEDSCRGKIVILDTVKKFCDLMDKKGSSEFMKIARVFISSGGTIIMLAHVNKHKSLEGKVIPAGTSDMTDDSDCAFVLYETESKNQTKFVTFENIKMRGNVSQYLSFSYSTTRDIEYSSILESVRRLANDGLETNPNVDIDGFIIEEKITQLLAKSDLKRTDLIRAVGGNRTKIISVLEENNGRKWIETRAGKNSMIYRLCA